MEKALQSIVQGAARFYKHDNLSLSDDSPKEIFKV